jgi:hypothetical protein
MTTSPFRMNPTLGPNLSQVVKNDAAYYDGPGRGAGGINQAMSPQAGDTALGDDGRQYMWVEASATITVAASPGTQIALTVAAAGTDPRVTAAAGAGGWYAPHTGYYTGTLVVGDRFWAAKGTAP